MENVPTHRGPAPSYRSRHGRLPWPTPEELSAEQLAVYRAIVDGPRSDGPKVVSFVDRDGHLEGPFNAMVVHPKLGESVQALGAAVRFASSLSDRQREIAILELARRERCDFEWYAHERIGRAVGLSTDETQAVLTGRDCPSLHASESMVRRVVGALQTRRDLDDAEFDEATSALGMAAIADLVVLVGYYQLLSLGLTVWRTPLPDGEPRPWRDDD